MAIFSMNIPYSSGDGVAEYGGSTGFIPDGLGPFTTNNQITEWGFSNSAGLFQAWSFLHYSGIPIPQGSFINSATLTAHGFSFAKDTGAPAGASGYIYGVNSDSCALPTSATVLSGFPLTTANALWYVSVINASSIVPQPPSITSQVQEIVNRPGWASGNNMCFIVKDQTDNWEHINGLRVKFSSYDLNTSSGMTLTIDYTGASGPSTGISGSLPLYISTGCAAAMMPSGDFGGGGKNAYPSGHWINSAGNSGVFWQYVNTLSSLPDSDYITTFQSGFLTKTAHVWYSNLENDGNYSIKYYDRNAATTFMAVSGVSQVFCNNKEGWIYYLDNSSNINVVRDNSDYGVNYSNNPTWPSSLKSIVSSLGYNISDMVYDRYKKKIYFVVATSSSSSVIYSINVDGTGLAVLYTSATMLITKIFVDNKKSRYYGNTSVGLLYGLGNVPVGLKYIQYLLVINLSAPSFGVCATSILTDTTNILQDIAYDHNTTNIYVPDYTRGLINSFPLGLTTCMIGTKTTFSNTKTYLAADGFLGKLYGASGNILTEMSLSGVSPTNLVTEANYITNVDVDGPISVAKIDFNLTSLPSWFGTGSLYEQVTNAYVAIKAQENIDLTNVYAKVLKSDKKTVIWENYPEGCAQFINGSGITTTTIGRTGSIINSSYNSLDDWNNAILRLECYSSNDTAVSGNFTIYSAQVIAECSGAIYSVSGSASGGIPMFIDGGGSSSGTIPLYIAGQSVSSGIPLFINAGSNSSGTITLVASGSITPTASIPLYLLGPTYATGTINNNIPLYMNCLSASRSGTYSSIPLYLLADQIPNSSISLYLLNADSTRASGGFTMYTYSTVNSMGGSIPITIYNTSANSGIPMYLQGLGSGIGALPAGSFAGYPIANSIPLFISRPNQVAVMPMFLQNTVTPSAIPLFLQGAVAINSGIPLVIKQTFASGTNTIPLLTYGW